MEIREILIQRIITTDVAVCNLCRKNPPVWAIETFYESHEEGTTDYTCNEHLWTLVPDPRGPNPKADELWEKVTPLQLKRGFKNYLEGK